MEIDLEISSLPDRRPKTSSRRRSSTTIKAEIVDDTGLGERHSDDFGERRFRFGFGGNAGAGSVNLGHGPSPRRNAMRSSVGVRMGERGC